jgi:hypothetical protein
LWGGHLPSEALRRVRGNVYDMARLERELYEAVAAVDPPTFPRPGPTGDLLWQ